MIFAMYMAGFAAYLLLAILVAWIVSRFASKAKRSKVMGVVFAGFIALPVGDATLSYLYFHFLCATQGGVTIYERVNGVDGYLIEGQTSISDEFLFNSPYQYMEGRLRGETLRYRKNDDGSVKVENVTDPKSRYVERYIHYDYAFNIGKGEVQVIDMATDRIIGKKTKFGARWTTFRPWLKKKSCPFGMYSGPDIVAEVLHPN